MIDAYFIKSQKNITVENVTQGDYGQKLSIQGLSLPLNVEVHFALAGDNNGIKMHGRTQNNITIVEIPNLLLSKGKDIIAYIFVADSTEGKTVRTIRIPVTPKPDIAEVELPPEDEDIVRELIVVVNDMKGIVDTIAYTEIQEYGEVELPIHTINDSTVAEDSTWSSQKINEKTSRVPWVSLFTGSIYAPISESWAYANIPGLKHYEEAEFWVNIGEALRMPVRVRRDSTMQMNFTGYASATYNASICVVVDWYNSQIGFRTKSLVGWPYTEVNISRISGKGGVV